MLGRLCAWRGACMAGVGCVAGGMCGRGGMCGKGGMGGRRDGHCSGRYASYWNAFLISLDYRLIEKTLDVISIVTNVTSPINNLLLVFNHISRRFCTKVTVTKLSMIKKPSGGKKYCLCLYRVSNTIIS